MRAISPNRQTGVLPHGFSRLEYLAQARSPPKSTRGSASPLLFGQDLVKVSASHFDPATFALAERRSSYSFHAGASLSSYPVHLHDHLELILERQPCEFSPVRELRCRDAIDSVFRTQAFSGAFRGTFSSGLRAHGP